MTAILEARGVTVRFGGLVAVNGVDLAIGEAEIHGLIGPNGAGKTSFFNAISGLVDVQHGRVIFTGRDVTAKPAHARALLGMRRTFQSVQLSPRLTALENVLLGAHGSTSESLWKTIFNTNPRRSADWNAQFAAREVLDYFEMGNVALAPAGELSFAQQRSIELARALIARPQLLMLDEPAAGLSPGELVKLDKTLATLRRETGLSILLVEHVISLVMNVCDEVTVLDQGRVIAEGPPNVVANDVCVKTAYLGELDVAG